MKTVGEYTAKLQAILVILAASTPDELLADIDVPILEEVMPDVPDEEAADEEGAFT